MTQSLYSIGIGVGTQNSNGDWLEVTELDVVFAYPWPGEEEAVVDLFEAFAADGTLLVTYHGLEDLRLQRKTG